MIKQTFLSSGMHHLDGDAINAKCENDNFNVKQSMFL